MQAGAEDGASLTGRPRRIRPPLLLAMLAISGLAHAEHADRVEYDSLANVVRLIDAASLRSLAGTQVTQSVDSDAITYDLAQYRVSSTDAERRALLSARPSCSRPRGGPKSTAR